MATEANTQSFWEHLDVLRAAIIKIVAVAVVFGIVVFFFKEQLFGVVLVPKDDGFITYQLLNRMAAWAGGAMKSFSVRLINTGLDGPMCWRAVCFAIYSLSVIPFCLSHIIR